MARNARDAALASELQRRFAFALVGGAALVALVFIPWGVYDLTIGNTRGGVYAFILAGAMLLAGFLAWRSARRTPTFEELHSSSGADGPEGRDGA